MRHVPALTNRWAVLALLSFARISMGLTFQSVPAVAPFLMADLGINYAQLGWLIGLPMLPGPFVVLPGGLLGTRFGDRAIILTALAFLTASAALLAQSGAFATAVAARLLNGVGGALLTVQLTKVTTDWFVGKEISTALGALLSTWPLGIALALATLGSLATATSWQAAVYATGAYAGLSLLLVALLYRDPPAVAPASVIERRRLWTLSRRELWSVLVAVPPWMFLNTGFIVFMSFTPILLQERGLSAAQAGVLASWASFVSIVSVPLGGHFIDRTARPNLFVVVGTLAGAIACLMLPVRGPALAWILLFGLVGISPASALIALPSEVLRPENRGTGFGAFQSVYFVGVALIPPLAGYVLDATGSAAGAVWFAGLLWLLILPSLLVFRWLQRRTPAP